MASTKLPGYIGRSDYVTNSEWFKVFVFKIDTLQQDLTGLSDSISQKSTTQKFLQLFDSAASGLKGFTLYPFEVAHSNVPYPVIINTVNTQVSLPQVSDTVDEDVQFEISIPNATTGTSPDIKHLEPATKSFIDYEPFTAYMMYVPFVGVIELPAYKIFGKTLKLRYTTDLHTGGSQVTVDNGTETLFSQNVQLGVTVPFGFTDQGAKDVARTLQCLRTGASMGLSMADNLMPSSTSTKTVDASGVTNTNTNTSYKGGVRTTGTSVQTMTSPKIKGMAPNMDLSTSTTSSSVKPSERPGFCLLNSILSLDISRAIASMSAGGDFSIFSLPLQPYIIKVVPHIHDINDYGYYYGYACAEEITIGDHTGYLEMNEIHMEELTGATQDEIDLIEDFLRNGVIICDLATPST